MFRSLLILGFCSVFTCCTKNGSTKSNETSTIAITFDNRVGLADLVLNTSNYMNANGESFTVSKFDYYISNIALIRTDGSSYVVPQASSYFLIKEDVSSTQQITLSGVPVGAYNRIRFMIGIDSLRNTLDVSQRTGVLDPAAGGLGMYWVWNSGYIFLKLEGASPVSIRPAQAYQYHIGGFGGMTAPTINNIKVVTLDFPASTNAQVRVGGMPDIRIQADVLKLFTGSANVSIATTPVVMFAPESVTIANNYSSMFTVERVQN